MRRKGHLWLWATLGVAAIATTVVLVLLSNTSNNAQHTAEHTVGSTGTPSPTISDRTSEPDETLRRYFTYVGDGQYEDMYEMLSEQAREEIAKDDFVTRNQSIYEGIEANNITLTVGRISDDGDYAGKRVEYSLRMETLAGEISYTNQAVLVLNENKEYRMQWDTHTIFPHLNPEDKVRVRTQSAERGCIYDRNNEMLAGPGVASAIGFVPGKMREEEKEEDIAKAAELLDMTPENIMNKLNASYVKDDTFVLLKTVSKEAYELKEEVLKIKGVMITDTAVRFYPLGEKASHLVGYIQGINAEELEDLRQQGYHVNSVLGKTGLEKIFEEQLRAIDGFEVVIVDDNDNVKETLAKKDKTDGKDITLTIDANIQNQLYDLFCEDNSCSAAINPKTGEVLALVSTPAYDANDFVLGMSVSQWTALNEDENKPMYNRFTAALCPGSTMKAITAAIGLNTGILSPDDDFGHSGLRWRKDESWGGYYVTTTMEYDGAANIENALVYSDNIFFAKAALKIGADTFAQQLVNIGFEERIPFEYGLYSSIISSTETFTSEIQLADSGFGQGQILVNPIHFATIYAAFVNEGNIVRPRLIYSENSAPILWKEGAFSPKTAKIIRDDLIQVVERGTGKDAKIPGVTLAGKTGTAELNHPALKYRGCISD